MVLNNDELVVRFYRTKEATHLTPPIHIPVFPDDQDLCTVSAVKLYFRRTQGMVRDSATVLIEGKHQATGPLIVDSHGQAIGSQRVSKLAKAVLLEAGIDPKFKSHSTRSAAISKAIDMGISKDRVMYHARISSETVLHKH